MIVDQFVQWFDSLCTQHGHAAIFVIMALGLIGVPLTEETAMTFFGFLVHRGTLQYFPTILAAFGGTACGITVMYVLGRTLGSAAVHKFGRRVGITDEKMTLAHNWFERVGKWLLAIGYFIPVVRQLTGIAAGVTKVRYVEFAAFAYTGALVWVVLFVSLGKVLGMQWGKVSQNAPLGIAVLVVLVAAGVGVHLLVKRRRRKRAGS